jgi:hypothetical protein
MQIDRTANLLLDVKWSAWAGDKYYVATLHLIREKAPFSRWRSLHVQILGRAHDEALWSTAGSFTNLESLLVWAGKENAVNSSIDRTITSHLKVLEITFPYVNPEKIMTWFAESLTHISTLRLRILHPIPNGPFLPANVVNLELDQGERHPFPHIQTYKLRECIFREHNGFYLRSMTTMIVNRHLQINPHVQVSLPALQKLTLGTLEMDTSSIFEAPALDTLHFAEIGAETSETLLIFTEASLLEQGYLLSPKISITADSYLPSTSLITILARSPEVTHAILRFDDWDAAHAVLARLLRFKTETHLNSPESETLCPRMSELRLDFGWELSEPSESRQWLLDALKSRRADAFMAPLSLYVSWKGEGTYVLLKTG